MRLASYQRERERDYTVGEETGGGGGEEGGEGRGFDLWKERGETN